MALSLTEPAGTFHLSGNPLWIKIEGASLPTGSTAYKVLCKVTSVDDMIAGGPFVDAKAPDGSGTAWFDISGYVDIPVDFEFEFPLVGGIIPHSSRTLDVNFIPGESYIDENGELQESFGGESPTHYVVKGGVGPRSLGEYNDNSGSFYYDYVEGGRFLTHIPMSQVVAPYQPVKLWLLSAATVGVSLRIKAYYEGLSYYEYNNSSHTLYKDIMHEINCLPYHNDSVHMPLLKTGGIRMTHYEVWIDGVTGKRTFVIDHGHYENNSYLLAANSLGGMDVIWLKGHMETGFDTESIEAVKLFPMAGSVKERTVVVASRTGQKKWKINTGWKSREEMAALADLLLSKQVWLLENAGGYNTGTLYPVIIRNTGSALIKTQEDLQSLEIDLVEAHNSQYL